MSLRFTFAFIFSMFCLFINGQISYKILKPCPEKISNTAVAGITISNRPYVYVFSGIDSTKNYKGIHARSYKYDLIDDEWTVLPELPGGQDRIAAGASTIKDKIYILGGYEVFEDDNEVSLNQLHIFDPISDTFLDDGAPIPTPIDDQVQVVYKDSLLYSVTGWSNNGNVNEVWMYNPVEDTWSACTPLPLGPIFSSFGSSGSIVGDTLYFLGGASEIGPFNLSDRFRKGYINPEDPTEIEWIVEKTNDAVGYRMGAIQVGGLALWLGGSQLSYNYDGIAYNGSGGVPALSRLLQYDPLSGKFFESEGLIPEIMDLRGLAKVGLFSFVSIGGMIADQEVTDMLVKYNLDVTPQSYDYQEDNSFYFKSNPVAKLLEIYNESQGVKQALELYNSSGLLVKRINRPTFPLRIDCSDWVDGIYHVRLLDNRGFAETKSVAIIH